MVGSISDRSIGTQCQKPLEQEKSSYEILNQAALSRIKKCSETVLNSCDNCDCDSGTPCDGGGCGDWT